ncbi:hypothetical protein [Rhodococcus kronopolitis]|uniref:TetR family transcriptional regulator n=1 Tax=Rhodococcus kronopolitis TaxID=1460226 RepID=A0ABV9FQ45_9NOCA
MWPQAWPVAARTIADATELAVAAVVAQDPEAFEEQAGRLGGLDFEQVGAVHSAMIREVLERLHPDGLTGDDVQAVLERCARSAVAWVPGLEPAVLAVVLTGSLGVSDPEEDARRIGAVAFVRGAVLVLADLLAAAKEPAREYLLRAIGEIARAETVEMP